MKTFKKIVFGILALIIILVLVAFLLPKQYKVIRTVTIHAPDSTIYQLTSNFKQWDLWISWTKDTDSTAIYELTGEDGKVGTTWKWNGKKLGNGEMIITETKPNQLFSYDLSFDKGKYQSKGQIIIESFGDSSKVSWTDTGDLGYNPMARYMGLFMDRMMGNDFEKGLTKLKTIAEERKNWPRITEMIIPEQIVLLIRDSAGPETFAQVLGKGYGEIMRFVKANQLNTKGHPFAIYQKWDSVTMFSVMDMGIAVEKVENPGGRIKVETIPAHKVVMARYFGPYDKTGPYYYALQKYCLQTRIETVGGPWEIYVTDPMVEKDPLKVETDILFPVK